MHPRIVFLLLAVFMLTKALSLQAADDSSEKKRELRRIKQEIEQKKEEIKKAGRKERSVLSEIEALDKAILTGESDLANWQRQLKEAEISLNRLQQENMDRARELERLKRLYRSRVRALYKAGRGAYLSTLILPGGEADRLRKAKYLEVIALRDHNIIKDYANALAAGRDRQAEINKKKEDIQRRSEAIAHRKKELEQRKQQKAKLLATVRNQKTLYEQTLRELEESSASLWAMIKKAEREKRLTRKPAPGGRDAIASIRPKGALPWPVEGRVITHYGVQRHPQYGTVIFRRGVEIEARPGSEVRAVDSGVVAYADWQKGYGKLLIIRHGEGYYTLYGYLARLDASKDEQVQKGQVIGLVGDTGETKGARLYFEIRTDGESQDPLRWLARR